MIEILGYSGSFHWRYPVSLSTVISVGLGLILIYYALGLVVNATTQIVKIALDLRARALTEMLVDVMGDKSQDFKQLGLIQTLKPLGKRLFTKERDVAEIPKSTFSLSILELLQPKDSQYLVTAVCPPLPNSPPSNSS
jgi:hypothetical protein